jgi:hypothetical protein
VIYYARYISHASPVLVTASIECARLYAWGKIQLYVGIQTVSYTSLSRVTALRSYRSSVKSATFLKNKENSFTALA